MSIIGTQRVGYEGSLNAKILIVGEAPGGEEEGQARPFVGQAGQLLDRYLERHRIIRPEVRLTNLCQYRPRGNVFELALGTTQLEDGLQALEEEIKSVKPNVVIALGGWPLWFLTGLCGKEKQKLKPGSGIFTYRGSRLPSVERFGLIKVFPTFHPSFVNRAWFWNPIFNVDVAHAVEDSAFPELRLPEYDEYIDPQPDVLYDLVHRSLSSPWISLDIENFPNRFSCVGWSFRENGRDIGVCVTYKREDLWRFPKEIWESDTPKIFQYATHDIPFMEKFHQWNIGGFYRGRGWDTFVASANIMPDYPRTLGFLASLYTRFPYYKDERKTSKEKDDMMILWKYNIKDCIATMMVALEQMGETKIIYDRAA